MASNNNGESLGFELDGFQGLLTHSWMWDCSCGLDPKGCNIVGRRLGWLAADACVMVHIRSSQGAEVTSCAPGPLVCATVLAHGQAPGPVRCY
jgi:hypothetical protein